MQDSLVWLRGRRTHRQRERDIVPAGLHRLGHLDLCRQALETEGQGTGLVRIDTHRHRLCAVSDQVRRVIRIDQLDTGPDLTRSLLSYLQELTARPILLRQSGGLAGDTTKLSDRRDVGNHARVEDHTRGRWQDRLDHVPDRDAHRLQVGVGPVGDRDREVIRPRVCLVVGGLLEAHGAVRLDLEQVSVGAGQAVLERGTGVGVGGRRDVDQCPVLVEVEVDRRLTKARWRRDVRGTTHA